MIEETIELLTEMMIEDSFKCKQENKEIVLKINKTELYQFCIKLIKLLKEIDEM